MLTLLGNKGGRCCDGLTRREWLWVGGLGATGLTWADLLRARAHGATAARRTGRAIIMVYLAGGPSHIDLYDMKPDAPAEYRGPFKPIQTRVPGMTICQLMPRQARISDKLALIRNMRFNCTFHQPFELLTGNPEKAPASKPGVVAASPDIGAKVSYLRKRAGVPNPVPVYLALTGRRKYYDNAGETDHMSSYPGYLGPAHDAFHSTAVGPNKRDPYRIADNNPIALDNLSLRPGISRERLHDRAALARCFDGLRRGLDNPHGSLAAADAFQAQAIDMLVSDKVRSALDVGKEPDRVRARYGEWGVDYLLARRLVEAGVPIVTLNPGHSGKVGGNGSWDHHGYIEKCLSMIVPEYDRALSALVEDLHERGLSRDVAVVVWGEMGRTPRLDGNGGGGRGHWPDAGFALVAGGGFRTGQVIGATDARGAAPKGSPYYPRDVLATLYNFLGYPPDETTIPDLRGRPVHLVEGARPIAEL